MDIPESHFCAEASRRGVAVIATIPSGFSGVDKWMRKIGNWPALSMVIAARGSNALATERQRHPNLLLGELLTPEETLQHSPEWSDLVLCRVDDTKEVSEVMSQGTRPTMIVRSIDCIEDVMAARSECDRLQREFAPIGDFSGYLVDEPDPMRNDEIPSDD